MMIETESVDSTVTARLSDPKGKLKFKKVGLRYIKENDPVFTGLSFEIKPGALDGTLGFVTATTLSER